MDPKPRDVDVLEMMDRVLSAALREVRNLRARAPMEAPTGEAVTGAAARISHTGRCVDILNATGRPLHVSRLLGALETQGIQTTRESLVSAISKKLAPRGPFIRTGPNTFGLVGRDTQGD